MATFTIDLLTGNIYLFSGNFSGSGSTPTSGSTYPQVNLYSDLPPAGSSSGQIYLVRSGSGSYVLNRKDAGLYFSNGVTWNNMPLIPPYFSSANFQVYDSVVNSKGLQFITSGLTAGVFRKLKIQDSDGTIAYLTDLQAKVDTSVFNHYTGITAPNTYLTKATFSTFTGSTLPANYYNKTQINAYTGATLFLIGNKLDTSVFNYYTGTTAPSKFASKANTVTGATNLGSGTGIYTSVSANKLQLKSLKGVGTISVSTDSTSITLSGSSTGTANWNTLTGRPAWLTGTTLQIFQTGHTHSYNNLTDKLTAGIGISINNNVISATGGGGSGSTTTTLQLLDTSGGINVNTIAATPIIWTLQVFSGTSLTFTGGSRIYVKANGVYDISYALNVVNNDNSTKNIGTVIRKNRNTDITPLSSSSISTDVTNNTSTNSLPQYLVSLLNGDYFELMAFRIGNSGTVSTKANGTWISIKRIN